MPDIQRIPIDQIQLDPDNANKGNPRGAPLLRDAIRNNGAGRGVLLDRNGVAIAGNKTLEAAKAAGVRTVVIVRTRGDEIVANQREDIDIESQRGRQMALEDNGLGLASVDMDEQIIQRQAARYDLDLGAAAISPAEMAAFQRAASPQMSAAEETATGQLAAPTDATTSAPQTPESNRPDTRHPQTLADRFIAPPFSVFDARQGYWQERKRWWIERVGLASGEGREETDAAGSGRAFDESDVKVDNWLARQCGLSIFDPVLAEIVCRWFAPPGGIVLDPCAGGSVRGIVAAKCGLTYMGIEPRPAQLEANRRQAERLCTEADVTPAFMEGYAQELLAPPAGELLFEAADLIFCCPPYHDLERYSDDPRDLSAMSWGRFVDSLSKIIAYSALLLKPHRFSAWVVSNVRGDNGAYKDIRTAVIAAHERVGLALYNEAVFLTPVGSLPIRVGQAFGNSRKLGRAHQDVLIFFKGEQARIRNFYNPDCVGLDPTCNIR